MESIEVLCSSLTIDSEGIDEVMIDVSVAAAGAAGSELVLSSSNDSSSGVSGTNS